MRQTEPLLESATSDLQYRHRPGGATPSATRTFPGHDIAASRSVKLPAVASSREPVLESSRILSITDLVNLIGYRPAEAALQLTNINASAPLPPRAC